VSAVDATVLTLDIDWVPDFMIDDVAGRLRRAGVPSTWFATHPSPALERLRQDPLVEVGIHPNFQERSTHGSTAAEVLGYCMRLVPDAVSMRTHGLVQSSRLLNDVMAQTPIRYDSSLLLPGLGAVHPVYYWWGGQSIMRIPIYWADDLELQRAQPAFSPAPLLTTEGLRVLSFHPIHVYLNASSFVAYQRLRQLGDLTRVSEAAVQPFVGAGDGIGRLFDGVVTALAGGGARQLRDFAETWSAQPGNQPPV
jgi:hypothetical protein